MKGCFTIMSGVVIGAISIVVLIVLISEKVPDVFEIPPHVIHASIDELEGDIKWIEPNRALVSFDEHLMMSIRVVATADGHNVDSIEMWYDDLSIKQASQIIGDLSSSVRSSQPKSEVVREAMNWLPQRHAEGDYERIGVVFIEVISESDEHGNTFVKLTRQPRF